MNGNPEHPYPPKGGPKVGDIYHLPTGLAITENGMMEMLSGARLVSVGETHDNLNDQRVELTVVRELHRRFPGKVAVGMEMFREPQQAVLDRWVKGELTELEFLKASKWYETWGFDFGAYRDLLLFAKENRIDVIALNPSKELQEAVRRTGLDNVPEDLRRKLPEIGETDPWQRVVLRGVFGGHAGHGGGDESFDSFLRVQLLWEETMAQKVVDYLKSPRGEGKRMVTITGGWHVKYGFGLPKKVVRRLPMAYAILLPEEISTPEQKEGRLMQVDLPEVPLLPAHFAWYVPYNRHRGEAGPHGGPDGGEGGSSPRRFRRAGIPGGKSRDREGRRAPRARRAAGEGNRRRLLPGRGEARRGHGAGHGPARRRGEDPRAHVLQDAETEGALSSDAPPTQATDRVFMSEGTAGKVSFRCRPLSGDILPHRVAVYFR